MSLKQAFVCNIIEKSIGRILDKSLCEVSGVWLCLADTSDGRRLIAAADTESKMLTMFDAEKTIESKGADLYVMKLNPNNAAVIRRFVKWAAPTACGSKGTSIGFSDWLGCADAFVTELFVKRQLKPVLVEYTSDESTALKRNFLEAVDTATWGVLANGYKEGYGANAAGLKTEEEIVKALLYGYSMIGFDCSDKIDLSLEKLTNEEITKRFNQFNEKFCSAMKESYLNVEFKVGNNTIKFNEDDLYRIVLEYGEAIMHVQFIYNSYLKNTPWDIDFELSLSKPGKVLTPQEHYLIANELQRNGIKLASICIDGLYDQEALHKNLQLHCEIADTFGYRLSFRNADLTIENPSLPLKYLKNKVHFKLNNILWLACLQLIAEKNNKLMKKITAVSELEFIGNDILSETETAKKAALCFNDVLNPQKENLSSEIKEFLIQNKDEYATKVTLFTEKFIKLL